ncbi:MAG: (deoxy)nucleoside triphosphate pyrophosphohydrolase [Akkermansiaceae bacterium]|nr:(deoxy)nucleoside triphosphate pyrophosphohydrolase [Akkermansiaceae bacterium]MCF7734083.1 (deoxy)nucleoside triphosphate pyrophosphohydrolase [Akkermansiaceae bacterium]
MDVVCGVIDDGEGRVLACRRPEGGHLAGLWEFPGGKVEAGESASAALVREMREELAVAVDVGMPLTPVLWDDGQRTIRLIPLRCRIVGGVLSLLEHAECRWCDAEAAGELAWAPADLPVLGEVFSPACVRGARASERQETG